MLTTPDKLLFFHLLDDDICNKLFHNLPRIGGEADWPAVSWVILLSFLKTGVMMASLQSSDTSTIPHDLSKLIENSLSFSKGTNPPLVGEKKKKIVSIFDSKLQKGMNGKHRDKQI